MKHGYIGEVKAYWIDNEEDRYSVGKGFDTPVLKIAAQMSVWRR